MGWPEDQPSLLHRAAAAAGAALVSAVVVNPLDVVKTRMQSAPSNVPRSLYECGPTWWASSHPRPLLPRSLTPPPFPCALRKWNFAHCPSCCTSAASAGGASLHPPPGRTPPRPPPSPSALASLYQIAAREGVRVLWRGTSVALLAAIPMVGVYLPLYDALLDSARNSPVLAFQGAFAPLWAGLAARSAAALCTAPFELVRTRLHLGEGAAAAEWASAKRTAAEGAAAKGAAFKQGLASPSAPSARVPALRSHLTRVPGLFQGLSATLARDLPFSVLYWGLVEPLRARALAASPAGEPSAPPSDAAVFWANAWAGSVAGAAAGAATTPLDVVKTRTQLAPARSAPALSEMLRDIARREGAAGLFQGWGARAGRAAPACAIVLSAYELLKRWEVE